jgi:hypothetical protein
MVVCSSGVAGGSISQTIATKKDLPRSGERMLETAEQSDLQGCAPAPLQCRSSALGGPAG